jgi:hypothetical protein
VKHFRRGYDGLLVYRLDTRGVLRGTRLVRRFGGLALFPITAMRLVRDWVTVARNRRQLGLSVARVPYQAAVAAVNRLIELAGGLVAAVRTRRDLAA